MTLIETWEDGEALDAHMKSEYFTRIVPLIAKDSSKESSRGLYPLIK
ncbi:MAG: hypothetical protein LBO70_03625 [Clostridiales Family XIII bacterium]|nr:hypothetical protein [Clostridiales Family XIII bacterium]